MSLPGGVGMRAMNRMKPISGKRWQWVQNILFLQTMPHFLGIPLRIACPLNSWIAILEIEYLPSFRDYYEELRANKEIDMLMLGQHHYEESRGQYFFHDSEMAYFGLGNATLKGMNTGLFDVVAHPDRIFKAHTHWCEAFDRISELMIKIAMNRNIYLEKNTRSMCRLQSKEYRPEFWKRVPADAKIIYG